MSSGRSAETTKFGTSDKGKTRRFQLYSLPIRILPVLQDVIAEIERRSSDGVAFTWIGRPFKPRPVPARRDEQFAVYRVEHHRKLEPPAAFVGNSEGL
jgi:hypothetical protein